MRLDHALAHLQAGWAVFPLRPDTKLPLTAHGFKDATKDPELVRRWWTSTPDANIGLATGQASGVVVVDVDVKNGAKGRESLASIRGLAAGATLTAATPSGGWHLYFVAPAESVRSRAGILPGIDVRGEGGYVVAPGSQIGGKPYEWLDPEAPIAAVPEPILALMRNGNGGGPAGAAPAADAPGWVTQLLQGVPEGSRDEACARLAGYFFGRGMPADVVRSILAPWAERCAQPPAARTAFTAADVEKTVRSIEGKDAQTGRRHARQQDLQENPALEPGAPAEAAGAADPGPQTPPRPRPTGAPGFSEDALAREFTRRNGEDWRYVAAWGQWRRWDGARWREENTLQAFDLARAVCREKSALCMTPGQAAKVASSGTVSAVERLAKADRRHAVAPEIWDRDLWLLNTPRGIVDLRTGTCRPNSRTDYMTKVAAAQPAGAAPAWRRFLADVTAGSAELQGYLARVAGYALTGVTTEHALFFLYGTGANGKSVFLNTLAAVLGDYAMNAPMDTFMETRSERHPTDLAGLRGARLVTSIEVANGKRWAEAKIKSLTGGDKISARFMRQDFFTYVPQFKLLVAGNNKPSLRDIDEAMRRRLHLVPFTVTIAAEKRDQKLPERLLRERDGILRWILDGCLEWQRIGLKPPAAVLAATQEYFEGEDSVGRWILEACQQGPDLTATTGMLFGAWKPWAEHAGEWVGTQKRFSQNLEARGLKRWRQPGTGRQGFRGLALNASHAEMQDTEALL